MNELVSLLPVVGIIVLFWLLIIRPQSKRQKALASLQGGLTPGNEVMLSSGLFGTVDQIVEDRIRLRIADGVVVEVIRGAVANVVPPAETTTEPTTEPTSGPSSGPTSGPTSGPPTTETPRDQ